ncbi:MAG: amidohydrolase family protein [Massilia sp.]|nr:amidohydrolase family protein [Massilia sp.]
MRLHHQPTRPLNCSLVALAAAAAHATSTTIIGNANSHTLDAAYAGHQEKTLGSLEIGKYADFIVVDRAVFKISPYDIHKMGVLETRGRRRQVDRQQ